MLKNITLFMLMFLLIPIVVSAHQRQARITSLLPDSAVVEPAPTEELEFQKLGPPQGRFFGIACPDTGCGPAPEKVGTKMNAYHQQTAMLENPTEQSAAAAMQPAESSDQSGSPSDADTEKSRPEQLINELDSLISQLDATNPTSKN